MLCTSKGIAVKYTPTAVTRNLRTLGEHASIQRKLLSLTVNDVAQRAGVSATTVVNLEHGKPVRTDSLFAVLGPLPHRPRRATGGRTTTQARKESKNMTSHVGFPPQVPDVGNR